MCQLIKKEIRYVTFRSVLRQSNLSESKLDCDCIVGTYYYVIDVVDINDKKKAIGKALCLYLNGLATIHFIVSRNYRKYPLRELPLKLLRTFCV